MSALHFVEKNDDLQYFKWKLYIFRKKCSNSLLKTPPINFIANNSYLKGLFCVYIISQNLKRYCDWK